MKPLSAPASSTHRETFAQGTSLPLPRGVVRRFTRRDGIDAIQVLDGIVWLTATPEEGDTVLRRSGTYSLPVSAPVVIEALQDASVRLVRAA